MSRERRSPDNSLSSAWDDVSLITDIVRVTWSFLDTIWWRVLPITIRTIRTGYPVLIGILQYVSLRHRIAIAYRDSCIMYFPMFPRTHYTILPRFLDHVDAVLGSRFTRRRRVALGRRRHSGTAHANAEANASTLLPLMPFSSL